MSLFDDLDLGASEYSGDNDSLSQFTSKPIQKKYQPFGGPMQQSSQPVQQPVQEAVQPSYNQNVFEDDHLTQYEQAQKQLRYINKDYSVYSDSARTAEKRYEDFKESKFMPFFRDLNPIDEFENDDDYFRSLDSMYQKTLKTSQEEDGFFGESDEKKLAKESLGKYSIWNSPNGLRDQYRKLKSDYTQKKGTADIYRQQKDDLQNNLTAIPMQMRMAMDDQIKNRSTTSSKNKIPDNIAYETPLYDYKTGEMVNAERTNPSSSFDIPDYKTGKRSVSARDQSRRSVALANNDFKGLFTKRRDLINEERKLRDRGFMFSQNGLMDNRPVGMSRNDVDLLDLSDLRDKGIKQYRGVPIEQAINDLGGEERVNVAKIIQAVRGAYSAYEDAQIKHFDGGAKPETLKKIEEAQAYFDKTIQLANEYGLTDEIVEQTEKKGLYARMQQSLSNAMRRGDKINEMSKYAEEFFLNAADQSDFEKFIEAAKQLGEIPTSQAAKNFQQYKSKGLWDSVSNLLFDNTEAIPELFVESLSSFLPAYVRTGVPTIAAGAGAGLIGGPKGALVGAGYAARANWGVASLMIEYSSMILQGMQELNIDWKNPKVFAAAWNNEITRDAIKEKALKKSVPIGLLDAVSGMMSGRLNAALHHGGNAFKGGKLIDGKAWARSKKTYPRFTAFQRARNVGTDIAADASLGMGGEFLGQAWTKEPGEAYDTNAIAAEGLIGLGPGLLGGAYEFTSTRNLDVSNVPFNLSADTATEVGRTGKIDAAGFSNIYNTFKTPQAAAQHIIDQGNFKSEEERQNALNILTDNMARMYASNNEQMKNLKIVIADRTPFSDKNQEGSFHHVDNQDVGRDEDNVIFINRKTIPSNPLGVFMHESSHFSRILMGISTKDLTDLYQAIGPEEQRNTMAQYDTKNHDQKYSALDEAGQKRVDAAMKNMSTLQQAEEWFAHNFVRVLTGNTADNSVKTELQNFLKNTLHPMVEGFAGSMEQGGKANQRARLDAMILQFMGYTPRGFREGLGNNVTFGQFQHERPGMKYDFFGGENKITQMGDEDGLNAMMREVATVAQTQGLAEAKRLVNMINKILGEKVLSTDMSLYTKRELRDMVRPAAEAQIAAEDAAATAKIYKGLKGKDAEEAVDKLTEEAPSKEEVTIDETVETAKNTPQTTISKLEEKLQDLEDKKKKFASSPEKAKKLDPKIAKIQESISKLRQSKSEVKDPEKKTKRVGVGTAAAKDLTEARTSAINIVQNLTTRTSKNDLGKVRKITAANTKALMNEKEFEKSSKKIQKDLLTELKEETGNDDLTEADITHGQIIAEMLQIKELQKFAVLSGARVADDLTEIVSSKEPDAQRVVEAFTQFEQEVEGAVALINGRLVESEERLNYLEDPKRLLSKNAQKGQKTEDSALGSSYDVVIRNNDGSYSKLLNGKFVKVAGANDRNVKKQIPKGEFSKSLKQFNFAKNKVGKNRAQYIRFYQKTPAKKAPAKAKKKPVQASAFQKGAVAAEIKQLKANIKIMKDMLLAIEPEKQKIDWRDVPHFRYHVKVDGKYRPMTLGELASGSKKLEDDNTPLATIYEPVRKSKTYPDGFKDINVSDRSEYLWKYTNWRIVPEPEKADNKKTEAKAQEKPEEKGPDLYDAQGNVIPPSELPKAPARKAITVQAKDIIRDNKKLTLQIDQNGNGGLYEVSDGAMTKVEDFTDEMIIEHFGKGKDSLVEDMKNGVASEAEGVSVGTLKDPDITQAFNRYKQDKTKKLTWFNGTLEDYLNMLDAARASAGLPEKLMEKPMTKVIKDDKGTGNERPRKDRVYFQVDNGGTTHAALALFRQHMMDKKNGVTRELTNGRIDRLRLEETVIYEVAQGAKLEILDDREFSGYKLQRVMNILERRAVFLQEEIQRLEKENSKESSKADKDFGADRTGPDKFSRQDSITRMKRALANIIFDPFALADMQGEESAGLFPKVHSGKPWTSALTEFLFYQDREDAINKMLDYIESDIKKDAGPGSADRGRQRRFLFDAVDTLGEDAINESLTVINSKFVGRRVTYSQIEKERDLRNQNKGSGSVSLLTENAARLRELLGQYETLKEEARAKLDEEIIRKKEVKDFRFLGLEPLGDDYEFLVAGEQDQEVISGEGKNRADFKRGAVDEGIPTLRMFSEGREKEGTNFVEHTTTFGFSELADPIRAFSIEERLRKELSSSPPEDMSDPIEIPSRGNKKVKVIRKQGVWRYASNNRALPGSSQKKANEEYSRMVLDTISDFDAEAKKGITSGNDVSVAQFVQHVVRETANNNGNIVGTMEQLAWEPSSKTEGTLTSGEKELKQLPGGPAGGILPYVWFKFITAAYQKVGLNPESIAAQLNKETKHKWNFDGKSFFVNGTRVDGTMFTDGVPDPKVMAEMTLPLIKAVADAGRLRISEGVSIDEDKTTKNSASGGDLQQRNTLMGLDNLEGDLPEGVFQNTEFDSGKINREVISEDTLEKESTSDMPGRAIQDKNIPQSFASANHPIFSKIEKHDAKASDDKKIMPTLFSLERSDNLTLDGVIEAFRNNDTFWKLVQLPKPSTKNFEDYAYSQKLKKHGNYKTFRRLILKDEAIGQKPKVAGQKSPKQKQFLFEEMEGDSALGSSYALSSGMQDRYTRMGYLKSLAEKAGFDEETRKKYRKVLENFDYKTSIIDQADPPKKVVENFIKSLGITDQNIINAIDVHALWHQYYGKGYNTVEQSMVQFVQPIKDAMLRHGVTNEMLGRYLLARAAPSRNLRLKKMYKEYMSELDPKSAEYKGIKKMLEERGDSLSGIETEAALEEIASFENTDQIGGFIADKENPLQLYYDMNREALQLMNDGGLTRKFGDINEFKAMITSMSAFPISKHSKAKLKDEYSYAPMQGFEGETETLFDNEEAFDAVGKSSASAGKGFDQPKHVLMNKGAFGRTQAIGPDPNTVFAVTQSQYFNSAIRAHKNTVSQAFGNLYEMMRQIAYPELYKDDTLNLPEQLKNLDKETVANIKEQFDEIFEKDYDGISIKKDYKIEEKQVEVDGKKVEGLKMYRRQLNTSMQNDPLVFVYRNKGEPRMIKFKPAGARVAVSMKNLRYEALPRLLQFFNYFTRLLAQMFTSLNPAFIFPNFIRDLGTAAIHLSEPDKKDLVKGAFKFKRLKGFMGAIYKVEQALAKGEKVPGKFSMDIESAQDILKSGDYTKMYQFAKAAGAKIGYFRHESVPELISKLQNMKAESKKGIKARLKGVVQVVESMNSAVENSIRMSAFWSAIEGGRTPQEAATISRNVTVDFNQKGNLTQAFGSMFVFFGASMNSAHRFARTLGARSTKEKIALIGGIVAASFVVSIFNRLLDDDEDEEMPDYDTITSYKRDTNLILPLPGNIPGFKDKTGRDTGYFSLPLPLGYNIFWSLGQTTADLFAKYYMGRGGVGPLDWMVRNKDAVMNAFNPIGGATLATSLMPTVGKPFVELFANKNFMGSKIRKEDRQFGAKEPAYKMDPKRTQEFWTKISKDINSAMGGDQNIKGSFGGLFGGNPALAQAKGEYQFDWSGSELEHLFLGYTGGPGQILNFLFGDGVYPLMSDKEYNVDINKLPIANRFFRSTTYGSATRRAYYDIRDSVLTVNEAYKDAIKLGPAEAALVKNKQASALQWVPQMKYMDGRLSKFRELKNKLEKNKNMSNSEKAQRIEQLERKELNMLTTSIKKAQALGII